MDVIQQVNDYCDFIVKNESQYSQKYNILVILTDGAIVDIDETITQIVLASELPLSIIIIGIGDAEFGAMEKLDADKEPLFSTQYRTYQSRDIAQFVPLNDYKHDLNLLAQEVLKEIPKQMVDYFKSKGIQPNPPNRDLMEIHKQNANLTNPYYIEKKNQFMN